MVYMLLADGFEEIEAIAPLDLLRRAGVAVRTVSIGQSKTVTGSHQIPVVADLYIDEATERVDMLILPGGMPGTTNLDRSSKVQALIDRALSEGAYIAAICAAPSILGKRGLLAGREATSYPSYQSTLAGAKISGAKVVRDGKFITAVGAGVAVDFGLALIEALQTPGAAAQIKAAIQV